LTSVFTSRLPGKRHRVRTGDDLWLEVREWGDPTGPELLLVPGVAQSYLSFVRQYSAPAFARFRVVSFDPRGHGLSDQPLGDAYYQDGRRWSGDVQAVIDALGLRRPVLAGWSLGGRIVRQYLVDHGDAALSGLAFISCRPVELPEVVGPGNAVMQTLQLDDLGSRIEVASAFLRACFERQPSEGEFAFALAYNMLCPFEVRIRIGGWLTDSAVSAAALRRVLVPTLIVHGQADCLVLPRAAEITAGLIPHAELSLYEGCGHSVFFEAAERFNNELARLVAASRSATPAETRR
jgi:non-heme chloroperoxidase